jgi:hypothetical protein
LFLAPEYIVHGDMTAYFCDQPAALADRSCPASYRVYAPGKSDSRNRLISRARKDHRQAYIQTAAKFATTIDASGTATPPHDSTDRPTCKLTPGAR